MAVYSSTGQPIARDSEQRMETPFSGVWLPQEDFREAQHQWAPVETPTPKLSSWDFVGANLVGFGRVRVAVRFGIGRIFHFSIRIPLSAVVTEMASAMVHLSRRVC